MMLAISQINQKTDTVRNSEKCISCRPDSQNPGGGMGDGSMLEENGHREKNRCYLVFKLYCYWVTELRPRILVFFTLL
jgi:hypothetical protein